MSSAAASLLSVVCDSDGKVAAAFSISREYKEVDGMGKIIDSPDLIETGDRIRIARQRVGLTQEELADQMGVSWNTVHRIEYAQAAMSIEKLYQIADILCVPIAELCPSRFGQRGSYTGLAAEYEDLNDRNKKIVIDTVSVLINGLLAQQKSL